MVSDAVTESVRLQKLLPFTQFEALFRNHQLLVT
jgi:hypothetical protein